MQLEFFTYKNNELINTFNNEKINICDTLQIRRLETKNSICFFSHIIKDGSFYKYDVEADGDSLILSVYDGKYNDKICWKKTYQVIVRKNILGIEENGDCDLDFWHEVFASNYGYNHYDEGNVEKFSFTENPMNIVRKVFPVSMQTNVFLFIKQYLKLKKVIYKDFDIKIFDIPAVKINKNVGKIFDKKYINYAIQREIELNNEVFFDITVISGNVNNGIMDIEKKHRYFLTEGFAYSPDGGDLGVFVSDNIYGNVYDNAMSKKYPNLMLDRYNGKYYYQYFFSRNFIPCFEILAKAGFSKYADLMLDNFYKNKSDVWIDIDIYGKNDKEIFGFKLNKLVNFDPDICCKENSSFHLEFISFIRFLKMVHNNSPYLLDVKGMDENLYGFIKRRLGSGVTIKDIEYIKSIGVSQASLYADYLAMCNETGKYSGGLYPKNLKHEHDVMITYINQLKEAKKNKQFEDVVSSPNYLKNLYEGEKYCILAPRTANDLVNESYRLSHCVKTYIRAVASYETKIYFLREIDKKSKSLVTLEVKNGCVCQARGKANRSLRGEEFNFVNEWAIVKGLKCIF